MKTISHKLLPFILAFGLCWEGRLPAQPAKPAESDPMLLTVEGKVELSKVGTTQWAPAKANLGLTNGDRLRTGLRSRAVVRWSDLAVLRVNELTTYVVQPPSSAGKPGKLDIQSGSSFFLSREKPSDVEFSTPLSSGAIRGTEFNIAVADNGRTVVTLLDGALSISNSFGAINLASGEEATVEPGQAPTKTAVINAINVIQWCLYYPGILEAPDVPFSASVQKSVEDYRAGDVLAALAEYPADRKPDTDAEKIYLAGLLLSVGQVEQSEKLLGSLSEPSPLAGALHEVIAAVKNQPWVRTSPPALASEWLAESYYLQAHSKLDDALKAALKAVEVSPNFGFAWARVAELQFSFGRITAANAALDKALQLSPRNAEAVALKGFLLAAQGKTTAALKQFDQAIDLDGALGNAWLGRGLMRIHSGDAAGGRKDLQVAATVEPQRAVLRSYLGKAFANSHDNHHAEKEFGLAKKLDSNDPTVWLYSALLNEQDNKINDAVRDLEKSQELNDNRSLYRSRLLLDQDRAVRGANLANIYRDAGMTDVSVREAVKAVNSDYANYSSHLFLANSFYDLRDPNRVNLRYETPYVSEYLMANLLAPAAAGTLSQQVSQQEYSKLFEHNGVGASSSTEYQSHGNWRQDASEYVNEGNTAFSFDQNYASSRGYRPNSDYEDFSFDFRLKQQLTPQDSFYAEMDVDDSKGGNLAQYYDQKSAANSPFRFKDAQHPIALAGFHHEWTPGMDTVILGSRLEDAYSVNNLTHQGFYIGKDTATGPIQYPGRFIVNQNYLSSLEIYSIEVQHIWQVHQFTTIAGVRYQSGSFKTGSEESTSDVNVFGLFPPNPIFSQNYKTGFERENVYGYEQWQPVDSLRIIGGVGYDRIRYPENFRYTPVSANSVTREHVLPKGGLIWTPFKDTTLRAGYSQSVGGASFDQSFQLEPVQIAGFNQAFRSLIPESFGGANAGAEFTVYGISLEQKLPSRTYLAVQADLLKSRVMRQVGTYEFQLDAPNTYTNPVFSQMGERQEFSEWSITGSAHQLIGRDWTFGAIYKMSRARLVDSFPDITPAVAVLNNFTSSFDYKGTIHTVDLQAIYQNPCGFFSQADGVFTGQQNRGDFSGLAGDNFWQINLLAGYRFYHRLAELNFGILNLTDQNYHLNPLNLYLETARDRTFYTQLKFQF